MSPDLPITILHTNDLHNHLRPAQAERLRDLRDALGDRGLLLDAGDAIASGNVTYRPGGEPILDLMTASHYDAMTIGNREFHLTEAGLRAKTCRAGFPLLCANVAAHRPRAALPVLPSTCFVVAGYRIAVFGLTVPMITARMAVRRVSAYVFSDPIKTAADIVPTLRAESDLVVCLSHIGLAQDQCLARSVPGIDLIIGGHTHAVLLDGIREGETLIAQAGSWARHVGMVQIDAAGPRPAMTAHLEAL